MIPAWKRLGLKLNRGDQSGDTAPDLNGIQNLEHSPSGASIASRKSGNNSHDQIGSGQDETQPLGKRKHQSPAEEHGQTSKKTKTGNEQEHSNGVAANNVAALVAQEVKTKPLSIEGLAADSPRPKGDPNYRNKQKGQRISRSIEGAASEPYQGNGQPVTTKTTNRKPLDPEPRSGTHPKQFRGKSPLPQEAGAIENAPTLLVSTEGNFAPSHSVTTPEPASRLDKPTPNHAIKSPSVGADRRKSVTFTPDTKTRDGNSAANFFKKWVAEQKSGSDDFSQAEVAQFTPPPKVHPANDIGSSPVVTSQFTSPSKVHPAADTGPSPVVTSKSKKKDPSIYLSYLSQYHNDRSNWKFNKAKQNDVLDNAFNIFRIPDEYIDAFVEYVKGLQGAGVIERLKQRCHTTLTELDKAEKEVPSTEDNMEDQAGRRAAKEEALEERIAKERKRRQTDADVEGLAGHPFPDGYIRRLKRRRVEALRKALGVAVAVAATPAPPVLTNGPATSDSTAALRNPRKRKSRTEVSSDESSSSSEESSSEEDSSAESSEGESESDSESSSHGRSENEAENEVNEGESGSDAGSGSGSSGSSESGSDTESDK
jgi:hypothetical protein